MNKDELKGKIAEAFNILLERDGELFKCNIHGNGHNEEPGYARKLHEVCINHKLANYLEEIIVPSINGDNRYFVDIEFNKEGKNDKLIVLKGETVTARPDIIIHNRISGQQKKNFLIVECKKQSASKADKQYDILKIIEFMHHDKYLYEFGLQVIYDENIIKGTLFYKVGTEIEQEEIAIP